MAEKSKSQKRVSIHRKMNVITKVIIPKLKKTIKFIVAEIEEKEREDVFRLKRFKQLKDKSKKANGGGHICSCCLALLASEEDDVKPTCPLCNKAAKDKSKKSKIKLNAVPESAKGKGEDNKKLIDHLMSHIDGVIDLTKQYKLDGIVPTSIDKFIETCNRVKETIEDYANAPPLCDICKKVMESTNSKEKPISKTASSKSLNIPSASEKTTEGLPSSESCYNLEPETDDKLGYFEKKFKEIVKVTRLQNEDGSVSEEKQVITIRTERRNPRKSGTLFSDEDKFIGPNGGSAEAKGYGGQTDYGGGTDYGGDGGPDCCSGPRKTKSEHVNPSHQMGEPRLRSCMSASHPKSTMNKDTSTNFNNLSCMSTKTSFVCGGDLESGPPSQAAIKPCKTTNSTAAQTCCKEVPVKKSMADTGTCCLPTCEGEKTNPNDKDDKHKTVSTEALWRDVWTSTTELDVEPSRASSSKPSAIPSPVPSSSSPSFKPSRSISKKSSPVPSSSSSKESNECCENKREKKETCCTIKIITKPPKVSYIKENTKEPEKEVMLPGCLFDKIKSIFLPSTKSNDSCEIEPKSEMKNICESCISKLSSIAPSIKPSVKSESSSSKMCQASMASQHEETKSCPSCGSLAKVPSRDSMSYKSMAIGSSTSNYCTELPSPSHTCSKASTTSLHSQKHSCCLEKKSKNSSEVEEEEDENTCCAMAQTTKSSKSICCSTKKDNSVCCPATPCKSDSGETSPCKSDSGETSPESDLTKVNATTSTRLSDRFDVRPLQKHKKKAKKLAKCTCKSDSNLYTEKKPVKQRHSFYEDDYYYFKW